LLFLLLRWVTRQFWPSLLVAALFAVHPLNVESVAWVAERKNLLSTTFFFLTIAAYFWYVRKPGWRRYLLVGLLFAMGLMAKPMVITLPCLLLLLDYWPLERIAGRAGPTDNQAPASGNRWPVWKLAVEKLPLLSFSAASAWITIRAQENAMAKYPLPVRIGNAVASYVSYLAKMIWPARLAVFYPYRASLLPAWQLALAAMLLISITALAVVYRRRRYLLVGWLWYLGALVPVIGLIPVGGAAMADRYAYITLIGIFIMLAWGLNDVAQARKIGRFGRVAPTLCALGALAIVASRQLDCWRSEYGIWERTVAVTERNPWALASLANALWVHPDSSMSKQDLEKFPTRQKRMDEARVYYDEALTLLREDVRSNPASIPSYMGGALISLASMDRLEGRADDARRHGEEALEVSRRQARQNPRALAEVEQVLLILVYQDQQENRLDDARRHGEEALELSRRLAQQDPAHSGNVGVALQNLGNIAYLQGRLDDARRHLEDALAIQAQPVQQDQDDRSALAMTLNDLGAVDEEQNRHDESRRHYEGALEIYRQLAQQNPGQWLPNVAMVLNNLGTAERHHNRPDEARRRFQEALGIYTRLAQSDSKYDDEAARMAEKLDDLEK
jgi:tetratricopeptide (TPR) repeat protein